MDVGFQMASDHLCLEVNFAKKFLERAHKVRIFGVLFRNLINM